MSALHPDPKLAITLVAHPPERRRFRSGAPAQAGQCCCCCCCCLHSVGSLIGAAVAPAIGSRRRDLGPRTQEQEDYDDSRSRDRDFRQELEIRSEWAEQKDEDAGARPRRSVRRYRDLFEQPARTGRSAVAFYWWTTLIAFLFVLMYPVLNSLLNPPPQAIGGRLAESVLWGLFYFLLFAPLIQLVAAIPPALILAFSRRTDKGYQFRQLGKVVLGLIVGGLIGLLIMALGGMLIWAVAR